MDPNKLTEKTQEALMVARGIATSQNNQSIDVEHLLAALIQQRDGIVPMILNTLKIDKDLLLRNIYSVIEKFPKIQGISNEKFYITPRLEAVSYTHLTLPTICSV